MTNPKAPDSHQPLDVASRVHRLAGFALDQLNEILPPHDSEALAQIAELRATDVGERRIAMLYPVTLADYQRAYEHLNSGARARALLISNSPLDNFGDLPLLFAADTSARYFNENEENFSRMVKAISILHILQLTPRAEIFKNPLHMGSALIELNRLIPFLHDIRRARLLDQEENPFRRALMRLRSAPALLGLDGTPRS